MKLHFKTSAELEAWRRSAPAGAYHLTVLHADTCTPTLCRCSPEFIVEPLTVEAALAGGSAHAEWLAKSTN